MLMRSLSGWLSWRLANTISRLCRLQIAVIADSDLSYLEQWVGDVSEEISCIVDYLGGGFVKIFAEFSAEAVEHEFGGGFASWIFGNESSIEVDVFFFAFV